MSKPLARAIRDATGICGDGHHSDETIALIPENGSFAFLPAATDEYPILMLTESPHFNLAVNFPTNYIELVDLALRILARDSKNLRVLIVCPTMREVKNAEKWFKDNGPEKNIIGEFAFVRLLAADADKLPECDVLFFMIGSQTSPKLLSPPQVLFTLTRATQYICILGNLRIFEVTYRDEVFLARCLHELNNITPVLSLACVKDLFADILEHDRRSTRYDRSNGVLKGKDGCSVLYKPAQLENVRFNVNDKWLPLVKFESQPKRQLGWGGKR